MATNKKAQMGAKVTKKTTVTPTKKVKKVDITLPKEKKGNMFDRNYPTTDRLLPAQNGKKMATAKKSSSTSGNKMNSLLPGFVPPADTRKGGLMPGLSKNGKTIKKKMQNGGSLSGLKASAKRVGPVDAKGAWTKIQEKTLADAKGKAKLTRDKELGAIKMSKKK